MLNNENFKKVCDFRDFNLCTHKQIGEIIKIKSLVDNCVPTVACGVFEGYHIVQGSYTFIIAGLGFTPEKLQDYQWWDMKLKVWKPFVYNPETEEKELSKRIPKDKKEVMESLYKKLHSLKKKKFKLKKPEVKPEVNGNA